MLLPPRVAAGVADGSVTLAFRRWAAPRVKSGGTFLTSAGVIGIGEVGIVDEAVLTDAEAASAGFATAAELVKALRPRASAAPKRPGDRRGSAKDGDPVYRVELHWVGPDPRVELRNNDGLSEQDIADIGAALTKLDRKGPWTLAVLRQIEANPGRRAPDLAAEQGRETLDFKLDVRKLKALGLTISLPVGYELSPRGRAYLDTLT